MIDLAPGLELTLRVIGIALLALIAVLLLRAAAAAAVERLLAARRDDEAQGVLPPADLERRIRTLESLAVRIAAGAILVIAVLMILDQLQIDIGPAVAGLGVVAIAVGLGAQALVKDWLSGILVVAENQYSRGDVVQIAGVSGVVEDFSLRRTVLRDANGTVHSVPNGLVGVASNMTRVWSRVVLAVSVAYETDIDAASAAVAEIGRQLQADPEWGGRILEPPAVTRIDELGESAIRLRVEAKVRAAEQWAVAGELRKRILGEFQRRGIEIPFPHRVVVTREAAPSSGEAAAAAKTEDALAAEAASNDES
jgi:small conductance mechanosensitive channel